MAVQILINIILAVFWLFLSGSYTMNSFVLGFYSPYYSFI